jgi:hypothetical protein
MSKIDPPTSTNDRPTNDSIRTRESLAATVILSLASTSLGLLGVYFLVYAGWTYLGSVEVFGRFPQAFKDAVRQEATSQFIFGVLLTLASIVLILLTVKVARKRRT